MVNRDCRIFALQCRRGNGGRSKPNRAFGYNLTPCNGVLKAIDKHDDARITVSDLFSFSERLRGYFF